jgi:hypothetical protein
MVAEEDDGAVVGFAHVVVHASIWSTDTYVYLEDPSSRRRRAGAGSPGG